MLYTVVWFIVTHLLNNVSALASDFLGCFDYLPPVQQKLQFASFLRRHGYKLEKLEWTKTDCKVIFSVTDGLQVAIWIDGDDFDLDCVIFDKDNNIIYEERNTI